MSKDRPALKEYVGFIWIYDQSPVRLKLDATGPEHAVEIVEAKYGKGYIVSLWNEDDSRKLRRQS